jgi:hypothetical protein
MKQAAREVALEAGSRIIERTPVDTGRARANWQSSIGGPDMTVTDELDPSGQGAIARLQKTAEAFDPAKGDSLFLTNGVEYIHELEYGSSQQAPHGMVRRTAGEFANSPKSFTTGGSK